MTTTLRVPEILTLLSVALAVLALLVAIGVIG